MKRKIAAIFAADIAGYSRLVAEDEEETLRRLASYRQVTDDFIAKGGGRIFNTAGDAVLAEFPSAVEAVRCAIDIQESLRTRNMAYPPSRQMSFRIGITIGDVVERDGDLLGDGVNIAARLEGLAEVGGICVSRAVHEQVANKLSVQFADIGAQEVKNIPTPVHAYMVAMRREDGTYATPQVKKPAKPRRRRTGCGRPRSPWSAWPRSASAASCISPSSRRPAPKATSTASNAKLGARAAGTRRASAVAAADDRAAPTAPAAATAVRRRSPRAKSLPPTACPSSATAPRNALASEYVRPATTRRSPSTSTASTASSPVSRTRRRRKTAALEQCQKRADAAQSPRKCELYAVGNKVVYPHGKPPVPPLPWIKHDPSTERPFVAEGLPLMRDHGKVAARELLCARRAKSKTIALGPGRAILLQYSARTPSRMSARRNLESLRRDRRRSLHDRRGRRRLRRAGPDHAKVTGFFQAAPTVR